MRNGDAPTSPFCSLGHRQRAFECPACGEVVTGEPATLEHWKWYRGRTSSKRIKAAIDEHLRTAAGLCRGDAGCFYGGFSCGYWLVADGCDKFHPETHIVTDGKCPCGHTFPLAGSGQYVCDHDDRPLPPGLWAGIGTPLELEAAAT